MSATSDFYFSRAEACAEEASSAALANVRDRFLRSERAWRGMARQIVLAETRRNARADAASGDKDAVGDAS